MSKFRKRRKELIRKGTENAESGWDEQEANRIADAYERKVRREKAARGSRISAAFGGKPQPAPEEGYTFTDKGSRVPDEETYDNWWNEAGWKNKADYNKGTAAGLSPEEFYAAKKPSKVSKIRKSHRPKVTPSQEPREEYDASDLWGSKAAARKRKSPFETQEQYERRMKRGS